MYTHKIKKENFESCNYNYEMKKERDSFGDYSIDTRGLRFEELGKIKRYFNEQRQALKNHLAKYSDFDFSDEARENLRKERKKVFDKYFNVSGDFMLTITLK